MTGLTGSALSAVSLAFRTAPAIATATAAFGVLSGVAAAPAAYLSKRLIDLLSGGGGSTSAVGALAVAASLLVAATTAFAYLAGIFETELSGRVQYVTQTDLAQACGRYAGTAFLDDPDVHERLSLARRGAHEAPPILASLMVAVVSSAASVGSFALILAVSWPWMLCLVVLTSLPMAMLQRRASRRMFAAAERSSAEYRWAEYVEGLYTSPPAARDMRLHGAVESFAALHRRHLRSGVRLEVQERRQSAVVQAAFTMASGVVAAVGAGVVAVQVTEGAASPGDFVLFTTAVVAIQRVLVTLMNLAGHAAVAARTYAAYEDFIDASTADLVNAQESTRSAPPLRSAIEFRNVTFSYPNASTVAVHDFSAVFSVGSTYALCGSNGSGKTTITRLLMRLYEPDSGAILWDGVDIREYSAQSIRDRISGVMQDFARYELSLYDNILPGSIGSKSDGSRTRVRDAVETVGLAGVASRLPQGLETMLSTTRRDDEEVAGISLSGGQWQRVALARAAVRAPVDVLVMDEPDTALDSDGTAVVSRIAAAGSASKVVILVTHSPDTARQADHVIELGSAVRTGCGVVELR